MPTDPALPTDAELDQARVTMNQRLMVADNIGHECVDRLISAARLVPVLMAERDAWRDWDKDDNPTMGELERRLDRIRKAQAATDAAIARAGVKMGEAMKIHPQLTREELELFMGYFERNGPGDHAEDCPEDDTCDCHIRPESDAIGRASMILTHYGDVVKELTRLRAALAAAEAENKRLRKVLEQVAAPDSQIFYIIRDNTSALVAEWSAVQYRMDIARAALAKEGA